MVTPEAKNYVKDIENKEWLKSQEVKDQVGDDFKFKEFDEKIEKSFQQFLELYKDKLNNKFSKEDVQALFNARLDRQCNELDKMAYEEIERKVIISTNFELEWVDAVQKLLNLQEEIIENKKENTAESVTADIDWGVLHMMTFEGITANDIVDVFNKKNFENKDHLLDLLKQANPKDKRSEQVKKFQRIIVWIDEDDNQYDKAKEITRWLLWPTWVDGMFWDDTLRAFKKYVDEKEIKEVDKGTDNVTDNADNNAAVAQKPGVSPATKSTVVGGQSVSSSEKTETPSVTTQVQFPTESVIQWKPTEGQQITIEKVWDAEKPVEYLDKMHEISPLLEWKWWETVTIAKWLSWYKVEIIPYIVGQNLGFPMDSDPKNDGVKYLRLDENNNITYTLPNENWEWTISIKLNKEWEDPKTYTLTMKALKSDNIQTLDQQVDNMNAQAWLQESWEENGNDISKEIKELRERYKEIVDENWAIKPEHDPEYKKMEKRMKLLYHAKEDNKLQGRLSHIQDWTKVLAWKRHLNDVIIDTATIYVWWKYLTKEEFLDQVENMDQKIYDSMEIELPEDVWTREDVGIAKITKLILTDDPNFLKNNALWDEEIQYDAVWYVPMKNNKYAWSNNTETSEWDGNNVETSKEKKAIRKLIRGIDKSLSIADEYYKKNSFEKSNLQHLREWLIALVNSKVDEGEIFNFIAEKVNDNFKWSRKDRKQLFKDKYPNIGGNIAKLWELYAAYKNNQSGKKLWDYFTKVMWLLDNYFVRGVKKWDKDINTFSWMYGNERIWVADIELIDPDKQKKAINQLFKWWLLSESYVPTPELWKLQQIVKNMDLITFFAKPWRATKEHPNTDPELKTSAEKKFNALYKKYVQCLLDGGESLDENWKPKLSENKYYNAVFDFLVWVWESRSDIVSVINSLKLYNWGGIPEEVVKEAGFEDENEMKLICMISDINSDWRVDFKDRWYKMWLEIKNIYKDAKVDYDYGLLKKSPLQNLVEYAKKYATMSGSVKIATQLKEITDYDPKSLLESVEWTAVLKYLQNLLVNSPADMIDNIFKYGWETYNEQLEITASQRAIQEIMNDKKFNETFEEQYKNLVEQWIKDTPEVKLRIKPIVAAWVLANITDTIYKDADGNVTGTNRDLSFDPYVAVWVMLWTDKIWDFTLSLWARGNVDNGDFDIETVWIGISWWKTWEVGKHTKVGAWASVWAEAQLDPQKTKCIPLAATGLQVSTLVNEKKLRQWLRSRSSTYFDIWASVWVWLTWKDPIPFVEAHIWFSKDQVEGIETKYNNIKEQLWWDDWVIMDVLNDVDFSQDETEWKYAIYGALVDKFYSNKKTNNKEKKGKTKNLTKKEEEELSKATDNIYNGILYYMIWTSLRDIPDKEEQKVVKRWIADKIAEAYAVSRKNSAYQNLDWKINLDQLSLWVMVFFLWYYTVVTPVVWFSFSRYRWLYSTETQASQEEYQRQLRTEWNIKQQIADEQHEPLYDENDHITKKWVEYINKKLQIANERVKVPEITFYEPKKLEGDKKDVWILLPKDLYKYVNINVKKKLENYASVDADWNLIVPENTIITLLTSSRTDTGKFDLIIWGKAVEDTDIVINRNTDLSWDAGSYEWDKGELVLDVDRLNKNMKDTFKNEEFPIEKCDGVVYNENKEPFALFKLKEWKTIQNMWWKYSKVTVNNWIISMPQTGTLTIYQTTNWEYQLFYQSLPVDNLNVNYEIEWKETTKDVQTQVERAVITMTPTSTSETIPPKKFNDAESVYWGEFMRELGDVLAHIEPSDVHNLLSEYHTRDWKSYVEFMDATCDVKTGDRVTEEDYDVALGKLRQMLKDVWNLAAREKIHNYTNKFKALQGLVNRNDLTLNQKIMVVDQCKMFFSYEANLTDGKNDFADLKDLIKNRWDAYKNLSGYVTSGAEYPLKWKDYRWDVVKALEWDGNLRSDVVGNLFGMTAFYKVWTITKTVDDKQNSGNEKAKKKITTTKWVPQMTQWRGYSMTEMWNTTPLWWKMIDIDSADLPSTKEWFWKNFNASELHKNILETTLLERVKDLVKEHTQIDATQITKETIEKILNGEEEPIDIWWKKVKISLDMDYVFYLLQECANESIGVLLNWITIAVLGWEWGWDWWDGGEPWYDTIITQETSRDKPDQYTVNVKTMRSKWWAWIYTKSSVSSNELNESSKTGFGIAFSGGARKSEGPITQWGMNDDNSTTTWWINNHGHGRLR